MRGLGERLGARENVEVGKGGDGEDGVVLGQVEALRRGVGDL